MKLPPHSVKSMRVEPHWTLRCACGEWVVVRPNPAACEKAHRDHVVKQHNRRTPTG